MFAFKPANNSASTETGALTDGAKCANCGHAGPLGYNCDTCSGSFCQECLPYQMHTCEGPAQKAHVDPMVPPTPFTRCSHPGCSERTPVPMYCKYCRETFCSEHKTEGDHECVAFKADAAARLKEAEEAKAARGPRRGAQPSAPACLRPDGLHQDDGIPFTVLTPPEMGLRNPHKVVVNKHHGVGKSIDWLVEALGMERQRYALLSSRTLKSLPTILSPFKELVRRGVIERGDVLLLVPQAWVAEAHAVVRRCAQQAAATGDSQWGDALRRFELCGAC